MDKFMFICAVSDVAPGSMHTYTVQGKRIALANIDGSFFAVDDSCSHAQCSLGTEGAVDGNSVVCGCHGAQFDMKTGKVMSLPAVKDIQTYEVKVKKGSVYIKV